MAYVSQESICKTLITDANKAIKKKEFGEAEKLLWEAVERLENAAGPMHPRIASVLLRLGEFYNNQHRHDAAEAQFRRAMSIYEEKFGSNNLDVAICLQHLAEALASQGRAHEAEILKSRGNKILAERLNNFGMHSAERGN